MALRYIMDHKTDDILRKKAKQVEKINDKILALLDDMVETMHFAKGVGLAAPQVGALQSRLLMKKVKYLNWQEQVYLPAYSAMRLTIWTESCLLTKLFREQQRRINY